MKIIIAIGIICVAVLATYSVNMQDVNACDNLNNMYKLAFAGDGESGVKDEADHDAKEACWDGTSCECSYCVTGTTDCSPTCSCCPEE